MKWAEKVPTMNIYNQQALDIVTGDAKPVITSTSSATPSTVTSAETDRKSTRLNSSHTVISYAVFCLKKKKTKISNICL